MPVQRSHSDYFKLVDELLKYFSFFVKKDPKRTLIIDSAVDLAERMSKYITSGDERLMRGIYIFLKNMEFDLTTMDARNFFVSEISFLMDDLISASSNPNMNIQFKEIQNAVTDFGTDLQRQAGVHGRGSTGRQYAKSVTQEMAGALVCGILAVGAPALFDETNMSITPEAKPFLDEIRLSLQGSHPRNKENPRRGVERW